MGCLVSRMVLYKPWKTHILPSRRLFITSRKISWKCCGFSVALIPFLSNMTCACYCLCHNPENNRFFVGTKSVFNKERSRSIILTLILNGITVTNREYIYPAHLHGSLPRLNGIYRFRDLWWWWCEYTPNCITYKFADIISPESIVLLLILITLVTQSRMQRFAWFPWDVSPPEVYANRQKGKPFGQDRVWFLNTNVTISSRHRRINYLISLAGAVQTSSSFRR